MVRRLVAFVVAVAVMALLGAFAHSWFVQSAWEQAVANGTGEAATLSIGERLSWAWHDIVNMEVGSAQGAPAYALLSGVGLLIAFLVAGGLARFTGLRPIVFSVAGAVAMFLMYFLLRRFEGTAYIFGARGAAGLAAQMGVGLLAGFIFSQMTRPQE